MSDLPKIYLARHGETPWSLTGQHTGRTDLPLTPHGEEEARDLGRRLQGISFATVLSSPLQRARRTCELAGFGAMMKIDPDLVEWNYGDFEGRRTAEIQAQAPDWNLFRDGCPNGETANDVGMRADRVIERLRIDAKGDALLFSHGHFLRVFAARWLGRSGASGRYFTLGTASISILAYEHGSFDEPVVQLWNDRD